MIKLDMEDVRRYFREEVPSKVKGEMIKSQQIIVYTLCGGGMLGRFAAEQPADFYIDDRVGKLPYPKKQIYQAVEVLRVMVEVDKRSGKAMDMPVFHASGIF